MTRDAEHTPTGYEDAASVVVNQAPAPSSLAGGEIEGESVALMRPFWVSWWGDPGTFELHRPWWVSGERDDGRQSICAAVLAQDEFTARLSVQWAHDDKDAVLEWRFVEEKPKGWSPFGGRFRQADWMRWPENAALSPEAPAREVTAFAMNGPMTTHPTLRSANIARQDEWDQDGQITASYRGNELAGEVGEACNVIKKLERERLGILGSRATVGELADELADVLICADLIAMHYGIDLEAAVARKFNATSEKVGLQTRLATPNDGGEA